MTSSYACGGRADRLRRVLYGLVVAIVPSALLAFGLWRFTLNHFYAQDPYLLDSGWFSALVHRAGFIQDNPPIACDYSQTYYGVHVSPLLSFFSVLSYAVPLDRIEWFAVFQAAIFAPLGAVFFLVASRTGPRRWGAELPVSLVSALAFCFSAQIFFCIQYPHFEIAISIGICILLVSLSTGRRLLAWIAFVLALSVREDAGLHTGLAILPLLWLARSRPLGVARRTLAVFASAAFGWSVVAVLLQKFVFPAPGLFRSEYLGTPAFAHLSVRLVVERFAFLVEHSTFLLIPFLFATAVAAWRRDGGYLLGYASTAPWFFVNLLAFQTEKAQFHSYTGFPFIIGVFWVYLYGALLAPKPRRLRPVVLEALVGAGCATSTLTLWLASPAHVMVVGRNMIDGSGMRKAEVRRFAAVVHAPPRSLGHLAVDEATAALAVESVRPDQIYLPPFAVAAFDAIAFHQDSVRARVLLDLTERGIDRCTHVLETGWSLCARAPLPTDLFGDLAVERVPPLFTFAATEPTGRRLAPKDGVVAWDDALGTIWASTWVGTEGDQEVRMVLDVRDVEPGEGSFAGVELIVSDEVRANQAFPREAPRRHVVAFPFTSTSRERVVVRFVQYARASMTFEDARLVPRAR